MKTLLKVFSASILALCIVTPALAKEKEKTNAFKAIKGAIVADQKLCDEVIKAAKKGDVEKLGVLREQGYNMDCSTEKDLKTPLMEAALHGKAKAADYLIRQMGVSLNRLDKKKRTALMYAAEHNKPNVIYVLRNSPGLDINAEGGIYEVKLDNQLDTETVHYTALMIAAKKNKKEAVAALLAKKDPEGKVLRIPPADANIRDEKGQTALLIALKSGHQDTVLQLIPHTSTENLNAYDKFGQFPLFVAAAEGREKVVKELLKIPAVKQNVNRVDGTGITNLTPLMAASQFGKKEVVVDLMNAGANVNAVSGTGRTALLFAVEGNKKDAALLLLQAANINVNVQIDNRVMDKIHYENDDKKKEMDKQGKTALMFAAGRGKEDLVSTLMSKHADLNLQDYRDRTALMHAAAHGKLDVMRLLLQRKEELSATINAKDKKDGKTALILAVEKIHGKNKTKIVGELLTVPGIDKDLRDNKGKAAVDHTKKKETVALLDPSRAAKMPDTPDVEEEEEIVAPQVPSYHFSGVAASPDND